MTKDISTLTDERLTRTILGALIKVLRAKGVLTDADAEAVSAEAFDVIRPCLLPEEDPDEAAQRQHEALQLLQSALAETNLPKEFLPLGR
jgi:hypothetical protein